VDKKYEDYLKRIGIDISQRGHPFANEYLNVKTTNNELFTKCFEHLLLTLILDLEKIKEYNLEDYEHYLKRIRGSDTSFWGQRFEIFWYSSLIFRLKKQVEDLRRGKEGEEADFIFKYDGHLVSIETTSVIYESTSRMSNPISKIKKGIGEKENKLYPSTNCCLIIDFTNLSFHRKIKRNFSTTISDLIQGLTSKFGTILFYESFHIGDENPKYTSQSYNWIHNEVNSGLKQFLSDNFTVTDGIEANRIFFRVS
jgi:hypothetical protein